MDEVRSQMLALQDVAGYEPHYSLLRGINLLIRSGRERNVANSLALLKDALGHFEQSFDDDDTRVLALTGAGEVLYRLRSFVQAESVLLQALDDDPRQADARLWLAAVYYELGATELAVDNLAQIMMLSPRDARGNRLAGLISKEHRNYEAAIRNYEEALRRDPQMPDRDMVLTEMAECQISIRQYTAALETLAKCGDSAEVLALRAECNFALDQRGAADSALARSLELNSRHVPALVLQGKLLMNDNRHADAVAPLVKAVELEPHRNEARHNLQLAYAQIGETTKAAEQQEFAEKTRKLGERRGKLAEQARKEPSNADVRYELAMVLQELDMHEAALNWLQAALAVNPTHQKAMDAISKLVERYRNSNSASQPANQVSE